MKLNWGLSIAIVYFIFVGAMVMLAVKASEQKNDLVTENYYEEAVNYQKKIDAENNTLNNESKLKINYLNESNEIELSIENNVDRITSGTLAFYKPDKATDDFKMEFTTDSTGKKNITANKLTHGYWKVLASWTMNRENYYEEQKIFIP